MFSNNHRAKLARSRPSPFSPRMKIPNGMAFTEFFQAATRRAQVSSGSDNLRSSGADYILPIILQRDTKCKGAARCFAARNWPVFWGVSVSYLASMECVGNFCLSQCIWFLFLTSNILSIRSYSWIRITAVNKPQKHGQFLFSSNF